MRALGVLLVAAIFGGGGFWLYRHLTSEPEKVPVSLKEPEKTTPSKGGEEQKVKKGKQQGAEESREQKQAEKPKEKPSDNKSNPQVSMNPPTLSPTPAPNASPPPKVEQKEISVVQKETQKEETPLKRLKAIITEKDDAKVWKLLRKRKDRTEEWLSACRSVGKELLKTRPFVAWVLLSDAYRFTQDEKVRAELRPVLTQLSGRLFYSFRETPASIYHSVEPGDTLSRIQNDYVVPYRLIMRINGLPSTTIHIGQRLKIPVTSEKKRMEAFVQVDKSEHTLSVFVSGLFVKCFKVGLGAEDRTPKGTYTITSKVHHPSWRGLPYGHPENIIGDWWLGLSGNGVMGIGIHGTNDPSSIGKDVSKGCVRMLNKEVGELANTVPRGTEVEIRD